MEQTTVLIADDHPIIRQGIRMMLENDVEVKVVGEASTVDEVIKLVSSLRPALLVLDQYFGADSSLDRLEEIISIAPELRIIIFTGMVDGQTVERAAYGGAHGVVLKSQAASSLLMAIKKVAAGEIWYDRSFTARFISEVSRKRESLSGEALLISSLTPRELEIVNHIVMGLVNKDVAKKLSISEKTVRNHLTVIYSKLRVSSRLELAIFANHNGLKDGAKSHPIHT
jgi:two-component system, NarL family, nitrate/nitrite response regulator NarL